MKSGLRSAKLKLSRAKKHVSALKRSIAAYTTQKPYKVVSKAKGEKKINVPKSPPARISILAGEVVYQMRSALDHLVFHVIKRNPKVASIDPDWFEHCEFPLRLRLKPGQKPPLSKRYFSSALPGISDPEFTFIESVQPYYRVGTVNNAMRYLRILSNIDKHRHLHSMRVRVQAFHNVRFASGFRSRGYQTFDRGAKFKSAIGESAWEPSDRPVYVNRRYRSFVAFNEKELGAASGLAMDYLLEIILEQIETIIVPAFEKFINGP